MQLISLLFIQVYTLFQLYLISINKKIGWQTAWLFLWVGALGVTALTLIVHLITTQIIPPEINSYTLNPLVEETLTLLPILLIAWKSSLRQKLGVLDWMLLGAALGSGFGLMEVGIRIVGSAQEWNLNQVAWSRFATVIFSWLPERLHEGSGYSGHGIAGALMGLGMGLWCTNRRLGGIAFLVLWGWAIFDHTLSNFTDGSGFWEKGWAKFIWGITGHGQLMPWALGIFILSVVFCDLKIHWSERKNKFLEGINALADLFSTKFVSPVGWFQKKWNKKWVKNTAKGRILFLLRTIFWLSIFLVFFCNGLLSRNFYRWYLQTPLWWLTGIIGAGFAIGALCQFLSEWRRGVAFAEPNAQLIFWGRGFLCVGALLFLLGSGANFVLTLNHHSLSDFFQIHFLYYAFNTFLIFFREGLSSALAVFAGLGGIISTAHAEKKMDADNMGVDYQGHHVSDPETRKKLNALSRVLNQKVYVTSGDRSEEKQKKIREDHPNAARGMSQHTLGKAADIRIEGLSFEELAKAAKEVGFTGIGIASDHIHVDTRSQPTTWYEDK